MFPKRTDGLCRCGCGERLEGRQRDWRKGHESGPVELFEVAKGRSGTIRLLLARRDHGVCAICGMDTVLAYNACGRFSNLADPVERAAALAVQLEARARFMALGFTTPGWATNARHCDWWQADHTVPLVEGGTNSLDNLRTLCLRCHKRVTAALAARRGARARAVRGTQPLLFA